MTHPIPRLASAVLAALLVALPGAALAQDASASPDLASTFPATLGGAELPVEVFQGQAWLDRVDASTAEGQAVAERTQALLDAAGKTIADLTVATALQEASEGDHAAITAVRVAGASPADLVRPTIALLLGDVADPTIQVRTLGGRDILRVADADQPGRYPRTLYVNGDTVWVIEAEQPLLTEIVDALPARPSEPPVDVAAQLVDEMPFLIGGERRAEVQAFSSWETLLAIPPGEMFGPQFEDAALRLFLSQGLTPDDLGSALGSWESAAGGVFILAFAIEGAGQDVMEGIMDEVIVPSISLTSDQPTTSQQELAGRTLTVVSDQSVEEPERAAATYYFLPVGDTVWMVNLASTNEAILIEALESLPES
jgi:hypothetical protein